MTKSILFRVSWPVLCIIGFLAFHTLALSPEEAEMQVLNLFYKAKELVVSTTHYPKPFTQVAENITTDIPIGIVDRIEVIKGPASSAWGSSLGGVINIITKSFASETSTLKSFYASYAERQTSEVRAEWAENFGNIDAYVFAQRMDSDGLRADRSYERSSLY